MTLIITIKERKLPHDHNSQDLIRANESSHDVHRRNPQGNDPRQGGDIHTALQYSARSSGYLVGNIARTGMRSCMPQALRKVDGHDPRCD